VNLQLLMPTTVPFFAERIFCGVSHLARQEFAPQMLALLRRKPGLEFHSEERKTHVKDEWDHNQNPGQRITSRDKTKGTSE
jgi:hypothetical protein